jgi:hypothetical protein
VLAITWRRGAVLAATVLGGLLASLWTPLAALADTPSRVVDLRAPGSHELTADPELILGTPRDDDIEGVGSGDVVYTGAGDDRVTFIRNEADEEGVSHAIVRTGTGRDVVTMFHRSTANEIDTGAGNDVITGGSRLDGNQFSTGPGHDRFVNWDYVFAGNTVDLGTGNDYAEFDSHEAGGNRVYGRAGDDEINGSGGHGRDRVEGWPRRRPPER